MKTNEKPTLKRRFTTLVKVGYGVKLTQEQGAEIVEYIEEMERQLAEATKENARLNKSLSNASAIYDAVCEQRDRLAEALEYIAYSGLSARHLERYAKEVLSAVKGGKL